MEKIGIETFDVFLKNRQDIQNFCDVANQIKGFVNVVDNYNFVGNAKSLLGVLRLCPSTLTVEVQAEYAEKLKLLCQEWVVK
jgi:hypothetical protein